MGVEFNNTFFDLFGGEHLVDIEDFNPQETTRGQENNIFHAAVKCRVNPQSVLVQELLKEYSLLAYQPNNKGDRPLHMAARLGHESFALVLIDHARALAPAPGPAAHNNDYRDLLRKVNVKENTALHEAVRNGYLKIAGRLIEEDSTLTCSENKAGESPLFLAVDGQFYDIASTILDANPDCSLSGRKGMTAMHAAVLRLRHPAPYGIVRKILQRRGSQILEEADDNGWMPHHYAANMGHSRTVRLFLEAKRCVAYIKDKDGMTALHILARNGHTNVIETLMAECSDIGELLDNKDRTALHTAVEHNQAFVVRTLLHDRAFIDLIKEQDNEGNTALHVAAMLGYCEIILRLASNRKTDKRILNEKGMTAFDIIGRSKLLASGQKMGHGGESFDDSMPLTEFCDYFTVNCNSLSETIFLGSPYRQTMFLMMKSKAFLEDMMSLKMIMEGPLLSLQEAAVVSIKTSKETQLLITQPRPKEENNNRDVMHMENIHLVVSTLIASVTFQAAISMPGAGKFDSSSSSMEAFKFFMIFNSLAFGCSAVSMLIRFAVEILSMLLGFGNATIYPPTELTMFLTIVSTISYVLAFTMGTKALLHEKKSVLIISGTNNKIWDPNLPGNIAIIAFFVTIVYVCMVPFLRTIQDFLTWFTDCSAKIERAIIKFTAELVVKLTLLFLN
ncbi:ankyrin repeat-containing protein ITN1-like [Humulus lupulus]|uniref:ankyrin repeat-containing protein ITN1-like n=1 Tax=Humulus lupulus TaxID=3486 RepID=UPI002B41193B|nr:ankyrin repeat-containing protein ITN1-like [Humulus lupulus]